MRWVTRAVCSALSCFFLVQEFRWQFRLTYKSQFEAYTLKHQANNKQEDTSLSNAVFKNILQTRCDLHCEWIGLRTHTRARTHMSNETENCGFGWMVMCCKIVNKCFCLLVASCISTGSYPYPTHRHHPPLWHRFLQEVKGLNIYSRLFYKNHIGILCRNILSSNFSESKRCDSRSTVSEMNKIQWHIAG